jgi:hypothetical protein
MSKRPFWIMKKNPDVRHRFHPEVSVLSIFKQLLIVAGNTDFNCAGKPVNVKWISEGPEGGLCLGRRFSQVEQSRTDQFLLYFSHF